jgi:hypothetical protein
MNSKLTPPPHRFFAALLLAVSCAAFAQDTAQTPVTPPTPVADETPAPTVPPIPYSGKIVSATGTLPEKLSVFADCKDGRERIQGKVDAGVYAIDLPPAIVCTITLGEQDWAADVQPVYDARTALAQTMLVYPRAVPQPDIAGELIEMGAQDRAQRQAWAGGQRDAAFQKKMAADERKRQRRLRQIVTTKGWPTISMVGAEAANEAWLLAQHAPPAQLKHWVIFMRAAANQHQIKLANLASSLDRVRMYEKRPQIYGSQYTVEKDGAIQIYPIEDFANVDQRRLEMGMPTLADYQAQLAQAAQPKN